MLIPFTKMQALGNDFVVFDATQTELNLSPEQIKQIADRRFGIGCDQLLLVENCTDDSADFVYRILNADGSEVGQCGNGARCFARYVYDKGLTDKTDISVKTSSSKMRLMINDDDSVTVNMGRPIWTPNEIPFDASEQSAQYKIDVKTSEYSSIDAGAVSMGNPHVVLMVDDIGSAPVETLGPALESHPRFPERVNVGFMQVLNPSHIRLRVYERGAGETLACGSGACAAVAVGRTINQLTDKVKVSLPGGDLNIEWQGEDAPVLMTGPANYVFEGTIDLTY